MPIQLSAKPTRLEFTDAKSNKFWQVSVDGTAVEIGYGRIGTAGRTQIKQYASPAKARAAAEKALNGKLAKGYAVIAQDAYGDDADAAIRRAGDQLQPASPKLDAERFAAMSPGDKQKILFNPDATPGVKLDYSDLGVDELKTIFGAGRIDELIGRMADYDYGTADGDASLTEVEVLTAGDETLAYRLHIQDTGVSDHDSPIDIFFKVALDTKGQSFAEEWDENG